MGPKKTLVQRLKIDKPGFLAKINILEILLSIVVITVVTGMLLWNWDGFWQTEMPGLKNIQETYFPAKHQEEQSKLINMNSNARDARELIARTIELEQEKTALKLEIEQMKLVSDSPELTNLETADPESVEQESATPEPTDTEPANPEPVKQDGGTPGSQQ